MLQKAEDDDKGCKMSFLLW